MKNEEVTTIWLCCGDGGGGPKIPKNPLRLRGSRSKSFQCAICRQ